MENHTITLNRWFVGLATLACFMAAAITALRHPDEQFWWGSLFRAGIVLGTLWFCLPSRTRPAAWADFSPAAAAMIGGVLILTMIRPRLGLPILGVILFYRAIINRLRW